MGPLLAALRHRPRVGRDEGGGERALREEVAQQVGDAEGDLEGVRVEAGAEEGREHLLADQAEHPREPW